MKCTTLTMAVGRGPKQPLASVDDNNPNAEKVLAACEVNALADQIKAGVDPTRVSFEREEREAEDTSDTEKPVATPKRKR